MGDKVLLNYTDFMNRCLTKYICVQYEESSNDTDKRYILFAYDGPLRYECKINNIDNPDDITDYETNYKDLCNSQIEKRDTYTGYTIVKPKTVPWSLHFDYIYFTTGDTDSLDTPSEHWTLSCPTTGTTVLEFKPNFDYYVDGGEVIAMEEPTGTIKMSATLAPALSGASWAYICNKKITNYKSFVISSNPKFIKYYSESPSANDFEWRFTHGANESTEIETLLRIYVEIPSHE